MNSTSKKITYISLFSGCGGLDSGFKEANFRCLGAYDIDPHVVEVHGENFSHPIFRHDLNDLVLPGDLPKIVDVVIAGSPCQGFSTIGKRKINDPRNHLLLTAGRIAVKYKAKVFVCENVPGSNSGDHKKYWDKLKAFLTRKGYQTNLVTYNASDFGVPQLRKRLILYAWKSKKRDKFNFEVETPQHVLLKDILSNVTGLKNHNLNFIEKSKDLLIAKRICQGQKLSNVRGGERSVHTWQIPEVFGKVNGREVELLTLLMKLRRQIRRRKLGDADPVDIKLVESYFNKQSAALIKSLVDKGYIKIIDENHIDFTNTFNGKFRRLDLFAFSPTVDTRFGNYKNYLHPVEERSLSVREAARIQGFNDEFVFTGPVQKQYEMIGNAVPPPLASFIAKNVKKIILQIDV